MPRNEGPLMSVYRCYFHNSQGVTTEWQPIYGKDDAEARLAAFDVLRERRHVPKMEVWRDSTRLFYVGRELLDSS